MIMETITVLQENNDQKLVANSSPGSENVLKIAICSCTKELSVIRGQTFLSSFRKILRLSSFHKLSRQ